MSDKIETKQKRREFLKSGLISILSFHFFRNNTMMLKPKGVIIRSSKYPVDETINRLVIFLQKKGATIYARINQQTELHSVGLDILPLQLILFGNPLTGGSIMTENPEAALDLPLKIIAWEDNHKNVWIAYNDSFYLEKRYALSPAAGLSLNLDRIISSALKFNSDK